MNYWRARIKEKAGQKDEAEAGYRELAQRGPFSFYGLLARARLKQAGHPVPIELPVKKVAVETPSKPLREPSVARATELIEAGMTAEAGEEIEHNEKEILKHLGGDKALPWLIDLYKRAGNYHRVYRLGESRGAGALGADPLRDAGHARDVGGGVPARLPAAGREVRRRRRQPGAVPVRDHAQGIGVRSAQRLVRRRARPAADDPADQHAGRGRRSASRSSPTSSTTPRSTSAWAPSTSASSTASSAARCR